MFQFIAPALFEKYINNTNPPVDEWMLSQAMAADTAGGGLQQLENHYNTFIASLPCLITPSRSNGYT